jgi:hypothetical protein
VVGNGSPEPAWTGSAANAGIVSWSPIPTPSAMALRRVSSTSSGVRGQVPSTARFSHCPSRHTSRPDVLTWPCTTLRSTVANMICGRSKYPSIRSGRAASVLTACSAVTGGMGCADSVEFAARATV